MVNTNINNKSSTYFQEIELIIKQFVNVIYNLHTQNITLNNLHPNNVLVTKNNILKIIDFSQSCENCSVKQKKFSINLELNNEKKEKEKIVKQENHVKQIVNNFNGQKINKIYAY